MAAYIRELCAALALAAFVAFIAAGGTLAEHLRTAPGAALVAEAR